MQRIILSNDATYCNSVELSNAIGCPIVFRGKDPKGMWTYAKHALYGYKSVDLRKYDEIIIAGAISLDRLRKDVSGIDNILKSKRTKIILTDTYYIKRFQECNKLYDALGLIVYIFPALLKYRVGMKSIPYYQPFNLGDYPIKKNPELTICHTPYHVSKLEFKGTSFISDVVRGLPVQYDLVMDKSWKETLDIRSRSHISVDAITPLGGQYINGVGKSGLEALWLKSAVITAGYAIETEYFNTPPIVNTTVETFEEDLKLLIEDEDFRTYQTIVGREWAEKYTSYEYVAKHVTR